MTEISYINRQGASDTSLIRSLGAFVRHHRVKQNKSQSQLATDAGIARSTLSLFERGENISLLVFIQLLRALKLLQLLKEFEITEELSPLQLAKLEQKKKIRAGKKNPESGKPELKADW
jgi:transcriptional regulator with XRE-family HTH domain